MVTMIVYLPLGDLKMIKKLTINQAKIGILLASYALSLVATSAVNAIFIKNGIPFRKDMVRKNEVMSMTEDCNGLMTSTCELFEYYDKLEKKIITVYDKKATLYNFSELDNTTYSYLVQEALKGDIASFQNYYKYCKDNIYGVSDPVILNNSVDGYDPSIPYLYAVFQGKTGNSKMDTESDKNNILTTAYLVCIAGMIAPFLALPGCIYLDTINEKKKVNFKK